MTTLFTTSIAHVAHRLVAECEEEFVKRIETELRAAVEPSIKAAAQQLYDSVKGQITHYRRPFDGHDHYELTLQINDTLTFPSDKV